MNREEAAAVLDAMIFGTYPDDDITIEKIEIEAVRFAIAALRGAQPQPAQPEAGSPTTQHCPEQASNTRQLIDACDRLRWLLAQAERVVRVEDADRAAVDRACRLLKEIDNGFDRERG